MEPVRPQVDGYLVDWITRQPLKREWFFEQRDGNCRLMPSLASRLSETAQTWADAVAPITEWVAQNLWSPKKWNEHFVPTRLTQRRRSEGRGKKAAVLTNAAPRRENVCEVCGMEGIKNRYCPQCAKEIAKDNMANVALIGRAKARSPKVRVRISETLSQHAVANTWWSASSLPAWLDEECFVTKIQPKLKAIKVREISEALQISAPYAALIRKGERRPHQRHWGTFSKADGVHFLISGRLAVRLVNHPT